MASEPIQPANQVVVFWEPSQQQWDMQQYILRFTSPDIDSASFERYANQVEEHKTELRKKRIPYFTFTTSPSWVMQELSDRRLPIHWKSVTEILLDPLGIDHFGFHTPLPRKSKP